MLTGLDVHNDLVNRNLLLSLIFMADSTSEGFDDGIVIRVMSSKLCAVPGDSQSPTLFDPGYYSLPNLCVGFHRVRP